MCGGALLGVGGRAGIGVAVATRAAAWRGVAQAPQNLNWGGLSKPQAGQRAGSGAAQAPQNFMPAGVSKSQLGQCMDPPLILVRWAEANARAATGMAAQDAMP